MAIANCRSFEIGGVRVTRIVEGDNIPVDIDMLLKGVTAQTVQSFEWLRPHMATAEGMILMSWQAFLVETDTRRILVDTCIGKHADLPFGMWNNLQTDFLEDLETLGCPREKIDTVLCTHLHFDHVGWNTYLHDGAWVPTFPNARYIFARREWDDMQELAAVGDWHAKHLPESVNPIVDLGLADFVDTDHVLCDEIRLEPTPGHTPGHVSVNIRSGGQHAVITGDMMHHPIQCALPDHPGEFDAEPSLGSKTRRQFLARHGNSKTLIIGSHFPLPSAGHAIAEGDHWRFVLKQDK